VIKFVSDLRQVGFSPGNMVSCTNKTDRHDVPEILLKMTLNTITLILTPYLYIYIYIWQLIFITTRMCLS